MEITRNPENGKFRFVSMSEAEYLELSENGGLCLGCDCTEELVEPDADGVVCPSCERPFLYGLERLLLMGRIKFTAAATEAERYLG